MPNFIITFVLQIIMPQPYLIIFDLSVIMKGHKILFHYFCSFQINFWKRESLGWYYFLPRNYILESFIFIMNYAIFWFSIIFSVG